jgi:hypothetical protein
MAAHLFTSDCYRLALSVSTLLHRIRLALASLWELSEGDTIRLGATELGLEGNMKIRWTAMITGAAVVLLTASFGAKAEPGDGDSVHHDHYWHHSRGVWHHKHNWDHARGDSDRYAVARSVSAGPSSAGPAGAPAPLLAAGIPAFALIGGGLGVRGLMRRYRLRKQ